MSIDLKPCPFCGSANVEYVPEAADDPTRFPGVHCMDCSAEGATGADEATCIAAWNRRPPTDKLEAGAGDLVERQANMALLLLADAAAQLASVTAENARLRDLTDRLKLEAQCHAGEARGANHTIYEIYQAITGATGEPGNWHGAEPVREYIARSAAQLKAAREHTEQLSELLKIIEEHWIDYDQIYSISVHEADEFCASLSQEAPK